MLRFSFPDNKRFAFTILDDTDIATVENVQPVYRLLERLGMRATKTVWSVACPEGSKNYQGSQTLEDNEYREFVIDLHKRGFEIASHGATMESSQRDRTIKALERFRDTFGHYPKVYANHAYNRENLYWGIKRIDDPILKSLYRYLNGKPPNYYLGHKQGSPYWWGDLCAAYITYVRNLTFKEINLLKVNPSMPYHDSSKPYVAWWFSTADADNCEDFNKLLELKQIDRLEQEGGICIISTHFGKGFSKHGQVHPLTRARLEALSQRPGWFPTVGELLDWMRSQRQERALPSAEWRRMQWLWARDLIQQTLRNYLHVKDYSKL